MNKKNESIKCSFFYLEVYLPHNAAGVESEIVFLHLAKILKRKDQD